MIIKNNAWSPDLPKVLGSLADFKILKNEKQLQIQHWHCPWGRLSFAKSCFNIRICNAILNGYKTLL